MQKWWDTLDEADKTGTLIALFVIVMLSIFCITSTVCFYIDRAYPASLPVEHQKEIK